MNLWRLNYELFLMGNNKTLMKSITFSQSAGNCLAFKFKEQVANWKM